MVIATYGNKVFQVDLNKIYTFNNFEYKSILQTEKQDSDGKKPSTYIKGLDLDNMGFTIKLDSAFGLNPRNEWGEWKQIQAEQAAYPFILGGVPLSNTKWLLIEVTPSNVIFDNSGQILSMELALQFEEYVRPGSKKESSEGRSVDAGGSTSVPGLYDMLGSQFYTTPDDSYLKRENPGMQQAGLRYGRSRED